MRITLNKPMTAALATGFALGLGLPAYSQMQPAPPPAQEEQQQDDSRAKLRKLAQRSQEIQKKLDEIASKAAEKNPAIREKQLRLQKLYQQKREKFGYPDAEKLAELRKMQQRLQSGEDLDDEERQKLTQEFSEEIAAMREAGEKARADEEFQEALQELETVRMNTMKAVDDATEDLQRQLEKIQSQIQKIQQQKFQQQGRMQQQ